MTPHSRRGARGKVASAALAGTVLVAAGLAACSSNEPSPAAAAKGCSIASLRTPLYGGPTGVIDVDPTHDRAGGFARVDAASGAVTAYCSGATLVTRISPGGTLAQPGGALDDVGVDEFSVLTSRHAYLPVTATADNVVTPSATVLDVRTGQRARLGFPGWNVLAATSSGLLLLRSGLAQGHVTTAGDFCVLPSVSDRAADCRAVPGASGDGVALAGQDGRVTFARTDFVPARFGSLHGSAMVAGRQVVAFTKDRSAGASTTGAGLFPATSDRRAVVQGGVGSSLPPVSWATVSGVGAGGVVGVLHTTRVPGADVPVREGSLGTTLSPDGATLSVLGYDAGSSTRLAVVTVKQGASVPRRVSITSPADMPVPRSAVSLVWWPASAAQGQG